LHILCHFVPNDSINAIAGNAIAGTAIAGPLTTDKPRCVTLEQRRRSIFPISSSSFTIANAPSAKDGPDARCWPNAADLEAALLTGDQRAALAIMHRYLENCSDLIAFERHVVQPALYDIGGKWQANQVTVAQEHMATAIAQSVMTAGLLRSAPAMANGKRALLACVEGNSHSLGVRMLADAFQLAGWEVQYLGANVSTPTLIGQVALSKPDLVGLSVSLPEQLHLVNETVAQLRKQCGDARPAILVGGFAFNHMPELAGFVKADTWCADAPSAIVRANQLVNF
jgi:methanogenic corrinoid protein MtbC1